MLPTQHKLTSPVQFRRTIKGGKRAGSRTVVVHLRQGQSDQGATPEGAKAGAHTELIDQTGPRFGLVVSKAVGNAVVRHRTSRRLRHVCAKLIPEIPADTDVVVRALQASGSASSEQLEKDMRKALRKIWGT